jgi:hypothetical protein
VISFLGAGALIESFIQPVKKRFYILAGSVLFIAGISFYLPKDTIFTRGDWWDVGLVFQPKYFFSAVFIFYLLLFVKIKRMLPVVLIGLAAILSCTVTAPAVLITLGLLLLAMWLGKRVTFREFMVLCTPIALVLAFIAAYTLCIRIDNSMHSVQEWTAAPTPAFSFGMYFKTAFNCFAGQLIKSGLSMFPYAILALLLYVCTPLQDNGLQRCLLLILLMHVTSLASYAVFSFMGVDSVQLWTILYVPLSAFACFLVIAAALNAGRPAIKIIAVCLMALSIVQTRIVTRMKAVDPESLNSLLSMYDGSTTVSFISADMLSRDWNKNINLYVPCPFLKLYYKDYLPVCLSAFEIPDSKDAQFQKAVEEIKKNAVFVRFVYLQKKRGAFVSIEQSKLDFIHTHKVRFVFTYPDMPLPEKLKQREIRSVFDKTYNVTLHELRL